jgi:pimeloyl-ACP methyl ester carboxylesterase
MASALKRCLFLHWGPGSHAEVERSWFGESLPIQWWDQPKVAAQPGALEKIIAAAENELIRWVNENGKPVSLLAHSFGGQIALELADRHPEKISSITLMSCGFWPVQGFTRLGRALLERRPQNSDLRAAIEAAERELSFATFGGLIQQIASTPGYLELYWAPNAASQSAKARFYGFAEKSTPLDVGLFMTLMGEVLARGPRDSQFKGQVRVFLGEHDPLLDPRVEGAHWSKCFPQAELITVPTGHFAHLELPQETWFPGLT